MPDTALVAGPRVRERHTQISADAHDVRLGQLEKRGQHREPRDQESLIGQQHHPPVGIQERRPAVGIDRMVTRMRAERDRAGLDHDRLGHRHIQHDRVTVGNHRDPHRLIGVVPIGHLHSGVGERRTGQHAGNSRQVDHAVRAGQLHRRPARVVQLTPVALTVVKRQHRQPGTGRTQLVSENRAVQTTRENEHHVLRHAQSHNPLRATLAHLLTRRATAIGCGQSARGGAPSR